MTDREKVVKQFMHLLNAAKGNYQDFVDLTVDLGEEIAALLKGQEAVEPKLVGVNTWTCGACGAMLGWEEFSQSGIELVKYKYCPNCGRAVKWNDKD